MLRYIALLWHVDDLEARNAATGLHARLKTWLRWRTAFDSPGLVVTVRDQLSAHGSEIPLDAGRGVVLGTVFRRTVPMTGERLTGDMTLEPRELRRMHVRDVDEILAAYWGSYVMFLRESADDMSVARGPMSRLQCYYTTYRGVTVFFSSIDDCLALGLPRFSINWSCVRAYTIRCDYLTRETCLTEVASLLCGETMRARGRRILCSFSWNPATFVREPALGDAVAATKALRATTMGCIHAWASHHDRVIMTLSGGLDSSIVASGLATAPNKPAVTCLNFFSPGSGDERRYARSVATRHGSIIVESERDPHVDLRQILGCRRTVSPVLNFSACHSEPVCADLARAHRATGIFDGELGDNVFGHDVGHEAIAEQLIQSPFSRQTLKVLIDCAVRRRMSVWRIIRDAVHYTRDRTRRDRWSVFDYIENVLGVNVEQVSLISRESLDAYAEQIPRFVHPWCADVSQTPPGNFNIIYGLMVFTSTTFESPFSDCDDPPYISPLSSQPLVELALSIPSRLHLTNGVDRALARSAFSSDLPESILSRGNAKGGPETWITHILERNRPFLKEIFLDGVLVRERILDRHKVEAFLSADITKVTAQAGDVMAQLYVEAWLNRWYETGGLTDFNDAARPRSGEALT